MQFSVKDTVDKLRSDARQEFKTKLNIEDCMVPGREKKQKERSKNSSSVSEVMNIDENAVARRTWSRKV
ncbi:hypothetical protein E1A91_A12G158300v1 [Gossypium mustelinum]|uniref:Uncharacterized protein n=1 Tax=Gossypium mustelinum TaxID=34275 RepID=A0A5D2WUX4_GOSMU|nr:hypothetical protein E1A91_A12G158300v1 [Gossypium mustelinum]